jgi:tRNA(Ile)-lysidine synthase
LNPALLVGYSGGGDSTALLWQALGTGRPVIAAIIDHGIQAGSAASAARAAAIAKDMGAEPIVRTLIGAKASQGGARRARYTALADIARAAGLEAVLLGHTRDDQAETVLMRAAKGAGPRGLAGMAAAGWCGIWPEGRDLVLARPLLNQSRAALRAALRAAGLPWLEDPANAHHRFARTHARAALAEDDAAMTRLAALAGRLRALVDAEAAHAAACFAAHGQAGADSLSIPLGALEGLASPVRYRLLGAMLAAAGGAPRPPTGAALTRLTGAVVSPGFRGATLAGARLRIAGRGRLIALRDPGAAFGRAGGRPPAAPIPLPPQQPITLDARYVLTAQRPGLSASLAITPDRRCGVRLHDALGATADAFAEVQIVALAPIRLARLLTPPYADAALLAPL